MVAASGAWSESVLLLREMIARTTAFRTWAGITGADEDEKQTAAMARVFEEKGPAEPTRPMALVMSPGTGGFALERLAVSMYAASGTLEVAFEADAADWFAEAPESEDVRDLIVGFRNNVGAVLQELCQRTDGEAELFVTRVKVLGLGSSSEDRNDPHLWCVAEVTFGA